MKCDKLNVLYSSDDNYAQHMAVSIYSLLTHNAMFASIDFYIIDNHISEANKERLKKMIGAFSNAAVQFIPFQSWKDKLHLNLKWDISLSSYARLFVAEMLPESVERVLYVDCDMIICDNLLELWNTSLEGRVLGAVQDSVGEQTKSAVGMKAEQKYFNAGLLLIHLKQWRKQKMGQKCLDFIDDHGGQVIHHDQGVLNGLLKGNFICLPLQYNLMTIHYMFNPKQIIRYYGEKAAFYSEKEIKAAKANPVILHYTPSFTSRPWCKNCKHPLKKYYWDYLACTPWAGSKPQASKDSWYVRVMNWKYRLFKG